MKQLRKAVSKRLAQSAIGNFRRQRTSVTKIPGGLIIGDLGGFGTEQRPPTQADLDALIGDATRVAVREPLGHKKKPPLFKTTDAAELAYARRGGSTTAAPATACASGASNSSSGAAPRLLER